MYANPTGQGGRDGATARTRPPAGPQTTTSTDDLELPHDNPAAQNSSRPTRVAVYVRTAPGTLHPAVLKVHVRRLRSYIDSRTGWAFTGLAFHDAASAATLDRPGLNDAHTTAENGAYDVLLVDRLEQLTRSMRSLREVLRHLDRCAVTVCTVADGRPVTATEVQAAASVDRQAACVAAWLLTNGWTVQPFTDTERASPIPGPTPGRASRRAAR